MIVFNTPYMFKFAVLFRSTVA